MKILQLPQRLTQKKLPAEWSMAESVQQKLLDAAFQLKLSAVKKHLKAGASVKKGDKNGCDALYNAVSCIWQSDAPETAAKQKPVVEFLIEQGADVNKQYKFLSGWTPVMMAACSGHMGALAALIDAGADIEKTDDYKFTPLMRAALNGRAESVKLLLAKGAGTKKKNDSKDTALKLAREGQDEDSGQTGADFKTTIKLLEKQK